MALRDELETLIGSEALRDLSAARGGRRVYVPSEVPPSHWLVARIGQAAADALAWRFGGCRIDIPSFRRSERDGAIRRDRAAGCGVAEIASKWGLSRRQIQRILAR